jgi:hypothetical protein
LKQGEVDVVKVLINGPAGEGCFWPDPVERHAFKTRLLLDPKAVEQTGWGSDAPLRLRRVRVEKRRGSLGHAATLRFLSPLIEPGLRISRTRLSDKTSRLRPRLLTPPCRQADEPEVPVEMREWIGPASSPPELVLEA